MQLPNKHLNVEIKARCTDLKRLEQILLEHHADYKGLDHQIDTYFNVPEGRLKLREGNIEKALIFYYRSDQEGPKNSQVQLLPLQESTHLKSILANSIGILTVVDKKRKIFFIENVKFHLDEVEGLGSFMEIEAIDQQGVIAEKKLREQCEYYKTLLGVKKEELLANSYSDMLLKE